jgi:hypothetical protein
LKVADDFVEGIPIHSRTSSYDPPNPDSESRQDGIRGDPSAGHADEAEGSEASGAKRGLTQILLEFIEELVGSANGLIEVYADRIRLSVRRTIVQAVVGVGVAVCAAVCLGAAALAILRGVCGGLTTLWGGREWLGDLTGGLLVWAITASAIALHLHTSSRRELVRLKAKYERIRNEHSQKSDTSSQAGDA